MAASLTVKEIETASVAFLQATTEQARAAAEARLLAFRAGPNPLLVSVALLELGHAPHAQFHALATLRERAHGLWPALDAASRNALQLRLLQLIAARVPGFVMREATQVAALLAKLALLDTTASSDPAASSSSHADGGAGLGSLLGRISELLTSPDGSANYTVEKPMP